MPPTKRHARRDGRCGQTGPDPADNDRISKACATLGHVDDLRDRTGTALARILELGDGIGAATDDLLPKLAATGIELRYVYSDISPEFLDAARERFAAHPFVEFEWLDIKGKSGPAAPPADVLLSANVLHDAHDVGATLTQLRWMTADRSCSCCPAPEGNPRPSPADFRSAENHVSLTPAEWHEQLRLAGFTSKATMPDGRGLCGGAETASLRSHPPARQHDMGLQRI
ncbi:class I SAM-dependent methyltransferase [Streptomyces sp. NPDC020898]|uniref:class I SAM-dependent methyltransferase n=1 Tax=Streptomyces sp. NPDC020898 TaxID=3365101 RepID=UPI0037A09599